MHPVLYEIGSVTIHTYGVLVAVGVLLGLWLARRSASRTGLDPERIWNLGVYLVLAAVLGSKLWLLATDWSFYTQNPREIFSISTLQSAGVFYGGLIAALIVAVLYARRYHLKFLALADVYAAPLALGHAIGRLGCFAAGCCYGKPTESALGVTFTDFRAGELVGVPLGVSLHPTQLYEAAASFLIFVALILVGRKAKFTGQVFGSYLMLYGIARGILEAFRGDPDRLMLIGGRFSVMQIVSLGLVILGGILLVRGRRQAPFEKAGKQKRK